MQKTTPWPLKVPKLLFLVVMSTACLSFCVQAFARCPRAEIYYQFLRAEYLIQHGSLKEALKALEKVVNCDPEALEPQRELVRLYAEQGQYKKAARLAHQILEKNPKDQETLFILAKIYLAQGRPARAIQTLEKLLEIAPEDHKALSVLAAVYLREKNLEGAIRTFERLSVKKPESAFLWLELARLYREAGRFEEARKAYEKALSLKPSSQEIILEYGEFLEKIGAFKRAEDLYKKGIEENPEAFHLYEALLRLYLRQDRFEEALKLVESLEEKMGENPRLLLRKALILLDLNREKEAEKILRELVQTDPENYTAWFYLGVTLEREGRQEEAIHAYENIPPESEVFNLAIRRLAVLLKDPDQIEGLLRRALQKDPDDRDLYLLAGSVFEDLDDCTRGLTFVQEGLKKFPDDEELALSAGLLLICLGKEEEALKVVEPFLQKDPDNPTLLNFVGYTLADLNRDLDRAEEYIKKALKARPDSGYIVDSLAWVYYRQGKLEDALKLIKRALKLAPKDAVIHEHHGDILLSLGHAKEALEAYRQALKLAKRKRDRQRLEEKIKKLCEKLSCS